MSFSCSYVYIISLYPSQADYAFQERFIEWVNTHADVQWVRMIDMAEEFRARMSPASDAIMPNGRT